MTTWECTALGWSVRDIINERKYFGKVAALPTTFRDLPSYYNAFQMPLLEESRAQLQQGLEELGTADYMTVESKGEAMQRNDDDNDKELIKLNLGIVRLFLRGKKADSWKPKPTDVLLLSTFLPENLEDLITKNGEHCTLALISNSKDDFVASFQVKAWRSTTSPLWECKIWYAIYVNNAATVRRIWDALHPKQAVFRDDRQHTVAKQNLYREKQLLEECTTSGSEGLCDRKVNHLRQLVERYCMSRQLNEPQIVAISSTLMGLMKSDGVRTKLLQGPPGTGKTTVITVLLSIVTSLKDRVLVSAPTNRAVAEIAERLLRTLGMQQSDLLSEIANLASPAGNFAPLHVGDVLLVGNEGKIDTDGILGDIYLNKRVKLLSKAMAPLSGWQASAREVLDILSTDSGLVQYKQDEELRADNELPCQTFLQFIRQKMNILGQNWIESGRVMCKHLPSKVLTPKARELLQLSCDIMENLLKCLCIVSIKDKQVRRWFEDASRGHVMTTSTVDRNFYSSKEKLLAIMENRPGFDVLKTALKITKNTPGCDVLKFGVEATCRNASLLFCTTSTAGTWRVRGSGPFDYAVVDEAGQLVEAETAIIAQLAGINQMLLVGDPKQLQATVNSKISQASGYSRSLFDRLQTLGHPYQILKIQYRMHPEISKFPNQQFYGGMLEDAPKVLHESCKIPCLDFYGSYAFISVTNGKEKQGASGKSIENSIECDAVQYILNRIQAESKKKLSVGVISPYKAQIEKISKRVSVLASRGSKHSARLDVDVKTVDGFQGGEKDVIIFSAVRANPSGKIGFLDDFRRLNVAVTRGRHYLWIIGHAPTLSSSDSVWRALIMDAKNRLCYHDVKVAPNLGTIIPRPLQTLSFVNEEKNVEEQTVVQEKLQTWTLKEVNTVQYMEAHTRLPGQASGKQVVVHEKVHTLALKEVKSVQHMKANTRLPGQASGKQIVVHDKVHTLALKEVKSVQHKKANTRLPEQASGKQVVVQEKVHTLALKEVKSVQHMRANTRLPGQASGKQIVLQENQQNLFLGKIRADRPPEEGSRMRPNEQLRPKYEWEQVVAEDLFSRRKEASKSLSDEECGSSLTEHLCSWTLRGLMCIPVLLIAKAIFGRGT